MATINNIINNGGKLERLLTICPSIIPIHDAFLKADEDAYNVLIYNRAYNKYVINGQYRPETGREYFEEVLANLDFPDNVKQAYWRACWYWNNGDFIFQYPSRQQVAAMMFRI